MGTYRGPVVDHTPTTEPPTPMRVAISGSRHLKDKEWLWAKLDALLTHRLATLTILHGGAEGVDRYADEWARAKGVPVEMFPADWKQFGKAAGPKRNAEMIATADGLLAFSSGGPGTSNAVICARVRGIRLRVFRFDLTADGIVSCFSEMQE